VLTTFPLLVGGQLRLAFPADNTSLLLRRLPDTAAGSPRLRVEAGRFRRGWSLAGPGLEPDGPDPARWTWTPGPFGGGQLAIYRGGSTLALHAGRVAAAAWPLGLAFPRDAWRVRRFPRRPSSPPDLTRSFA
jgi:hypothetical protein